MVEVASNGIRIHYETEGDGPCIILHTGAGGDLRMWRLAGYVEGLSGYSLALMDHRGHGSSDRPSERGQHDIMCYVEDVIAVADDIGVERFIFFGYSDGASVGYQLAASRPERVAGLVALGAIGSPGESMESRNEVANEVRSTGTAGLVAALRKEEGELVDWFEQQMLSTDAEMLALELESWSAWDGPWPLLPSIAVPTLLAVGELEEGPLGVAAANARLAARTLPRGTAVVLSGVGHCAAFVRSDLLLPAVGAFLRTLDLS